MENLLDRSYRVQISGDISTRLACLFIQDASFSSFGYLHFRVLHAFIFRVLGAFIFEFWVPSFSSYGCLHFRVLGAFIFEFWVLHFRILGILFSSFGCFIFESRWFTVCISLSVQNTDI